MTTILLGLLTAVTYGFADFFGAVASKKIKPIVVTGVASASGLVLLLIAATWMGADYSASAVSWGIASGLASAFALSCLYAALALGPISIVSPITAVISAIVPAIVGLAQGDSFSVWGWLALGLILVAVVLVGFVPGDDVRLPTTPALLYSLGAGFGIGLVLIFLDAAPADSGLAPIILLRTVGAIVLAVASFIAIALDRRAGRKAEPASSKFWTAVVITGVFDSLANIFFISASRSGSLTVVGVLTALYPVGTILLARLILKERIAVSQSIGIALAIGGSVLLAL